MYQSTYAVGVDMVQKQFFNSYRVVYFIIFVVILNFFIVNLFVGVIVSSYNRQKEKSGKDYLITDAQKKWIKTQMVIIYAKPKFYLKKPK